MMGYGLWPIVVINTLVILVFVFSFTRPKSFRDWRSFGAFSAFIVALFTEMYGFPLTIYLLSGWLGNQQISGHDAGHLWYTLLGMSGDPHTNPIHFASEIMIFGGLLFLMFTWRQLYKAQREHRLAKSGPYRFVRHPQYIAFLFILSGYLLQWPTLPTLVMFPILAVMYIRLAGKEERESLLEFGEEYQKYMEETPAFIPRFGKKPGFIAGGSESGK